MIKHIVFPFVVLLMLLVLSGDLSSTAVGAANTTTTTTAAATTTTPTPPPPTTTITVAPTTTPTPTTTAPTSSPPTNASTTTAAPGYKKGDKNMGVVIGVVIAWVVVIIGVIILWRRHSNRQTPPGMDKPNPAPNENEEPLQNASSFQSSVARENSSSNVVGAPNLRTPNPSMVSNSAPPLSPAGAAAGAVTFTDSTTDHPMHSASPKTLYANVTEREEAPPKMNLSRRGSASDFL